jgi:hypothetical protein
MMKKTVLIVCSAALFFMGLGICYAQDVEFTLQCPENIKAGNPLDVTVSNILNDEDPQDPEAGPAVIGHALVGLGGNMGNSVTGIALFGPFSRPFSLTVQPGQTVSGPWVLRIIDKVPASLAGKVAMATVMFSNAGYSENFGGNSCGVNVTK